MLKYGGYVGSTLRVNLTTKNLKTEPLDEKYAEMFIGGRGLAAKILFDEVPAKTDPLGSDNKLVFATGPLVGSFILGSSRFVLSTKSPLTGIYAYTIGGGWFGPALKRSGFDLVIVEGKSVEPVYLFIDDGKASLQDARWLWGMPIFDVIRLVKETVSPEVRLVSIGPAGEKLVKFASVITDDRRASGRCGTGAVMGSKKLKAVVVRGRREITIADNEAFKQALKESYDRLKEKPGPWDGFPETGTQSGPRQLDTWGIFPTRNWREATFEGASKISHPELRDKFVVKDIGCPGCPIKCTKITVVREGPYAGAVSDGPEYETQYSFGGACGVDSPEAIIAADMICDNLGIDTISAGVTVAWAMECFDNGLLTLNDTDGLQLRFGNHEALIEALKRIAYRQGKLGEMLAEGSRNASLKLGKESEKYAMHAKGLELGGYDPRGVRGMAIVFACGPRGGCHHAYGATAYVEYPKGIPLETKGKGKLVQGTGRSRILFDSSCMCTFMLAIPLTHLAKLVSAITGMELDQEEFMKIGERIATVERAFNVREGITRKDDTLPIRLMTEPLPSGPNKGQVVTSEELELMKHEFYEAMGWDVDTGIPTKATLEALDLGDVADILARLGKLPK